MSNYYEGCGEIDVEDALVELGLDNVNYIGHDEYEFSCPYDDHALGDQNPSNHMNSEKLVWRCKGCHRSGTLLEMVGKMIKGSPIEALRWLKQRYGEVFRPLKGSAELEMEAMMSRWAAKKTEHRFPSEAETVGPLSIFSMDWRSSELAAVYMRDRGFAPEVLEDWGFGFDRWSKRVTIPIRDEEGKLFGFKGRSIDPNADVRYSLLGDKDGEHNRFGVGYGFDMHDTSKVVFGVDRARRKGRKAVLVEGELNDVAIEVAIDEMGCIGIGMSSLSVEQLRIIAWNFDELVVFLDHDAAGVGATWGSYDRDNDRWRDGITYQLASRVRCSVVPPHEGDPASMSPEERRYWVDQARPWIQVATS